MDVECDRISDVPNDLIDKILFSGSIKDAINTSCLSSRWRSRWSSMPYLSLSTNDAGDFSNFVTNVLSHRDDQVDLASVKLNFCGQVGYAAAQQIMNYASEHNVRQLDFTWLLRDNTEITRSVFRCESLKHLTLTGLERFHHTIKTPSTWDLPALETAYLQNVNLCVDNAIGIFSNCENLESLTLKKCGLLGSNCLSIDHPKLSNLTLEDIYFRVRVVASQLKNLTRRNGSNVHLASVPNLASLLYRDAHDCQLSVEGIHSLEKVDMCIRAPNRYNETTHNFVSLLERLHTVKFLTLNLELVEVLSSRVEVISGQPSPFANLKSLKIHPVYNTSDEPAVTEVINYLLGASASVAFTMVSGKEVEAFKNAVSVQNLMAELRLILDQEKARVNTNTNITATNQPMEENLEPVEKMQLQIEGKMEQIKSCLKNIGEQFDQGSKNIHCIVSKLREIEVLLLKDLPASKRDKLQACFSSLGEEVDAVVKEIVDGMKNQYDDMAVVF